MEGGEIISDNKKTTEIFHEHFTYTGKILNIPNIKLTNQSVNESIINTDPIDNIKHTNDNHSTTLRIREHIHQTQMETEINLLNPNKAPGVDGIPANILKGTSDTLKSPLTKLYNIFVENRQFPQNLKFADLTPKDDNTDKANYRPVSVLPSTWKLFERLMLKQITTFVVNLISQYLCGFRKDYNTQHVLLRLLDKLNKSVDRAKKSGCFYDGLFKGF